MALQETLTLEEGDRHLPKDEGLDMILVIEAEGIIPTDTAGTMIGEIASIGTIKALVTLNIAQEKTITTQENEQTIECTATEDKVVQAADPIHLLLIIDLTADPGHQLRTACLHKNKEMSRRKREV